MSSLVAIDVFRMRLSSYVNCYSSRMTLNQQEEPNGDGISLNFDLAAEKEARGSLRAKLSSLEEVRQITNEPRFADFKKKVTLLLHEVELGVDIAEHLRGFDGKGSKKSRIKKALQVLSRPIDGTGDASVKRKNVTADKVIALLRERQEILFGKIQNKSSNLNSDVLALRKEVFDKEQLRLAELAQEAKRFTYFDKDGVVEDLVNYHAPENTEGLIADEESAGLLKVFREESSHVFFHLKTTFQRLWNDENKEAQEAIEDRDPTALAPGRLQALAYLGYLRCEEHQRDEFNKELHIDDDLDEIEHEVCRLIALKFTDEMFLYRSCLLQKEYVAQEVSAHSNGSVTKAEYERLFLFLNNVSQRATLVDPSMSFLTARSEVEKSRRLDSVLNEALIFSLKETKEEKVQKLVEYFFEYIMAGKPDYKLATAVLVSLYKLDNCGKYFARCFRKLPCAQQSDFLDEAFIEMSPRLFVNLARGLFRHDKPRKSLDLLTSSFFSTKSTFLCERYRQMIFQTLRIAEGDLRKFFICRLADGIFFSTLSSGKMKRKYANILLEYGLFEKAYLLSKDVFLSKMVDSNCMRKEHWQSLHIRFTEKVAFEAFKSGRVELAKQCFDHCFNCRHDKTISKINFLRVPIQNIIQRIENELLSKPWKQQYLRRHLVSLKGLIDYYKDLFEIDFIKEKCCRSLAYSVFFDSVRDQKAVLAFSNIPGIGREFKKSFHKMYLYMKRYHVGNTAEYKQFLDTMPAGLDSDFALIFKQALASVTSEKIAEGNLRDIAGYYLQEHVNNSEGNRESKRAISNRLLVSSTKAGLVALSVLIKSEHGHYDSKSTEYFRHHVVLGLNAMVSDNDYSLVPVYSRNIRGYREIINQFFQNQPKFRSK